MRQYRQIEVSIETWDKLNRIKDAYSCLVHKPISFDTVLRILMLAKVDFEMLMVLES